MMPSPPLNLKFLLLSIASLLLSACGNDDNSSPNYTSQRKMQLDNLYQNGVASAHTNFVIACEQLQQALETLSTTPDLTNLSTAKEQWLNTILKWKHCELYDVGRINNSHVHFRIQRWPIDPEGLAQVLTTEEVVDETFISSRGSSIIGLSTIEYLLFSQEENETLLALSTDDNYRAYINSLGQYLLTEASNLQIAWETYKTEFIAATGTGLDGGQNMIANALIAYLEETIKLRLGHALGQDNGGTTIYTELEAPYAKKSLELITESFAEWKLMYSGNYPNSTDNYGFEDFLLELEYDEIDANIQQAIQNVDSQLLALSATPLRDLLDDNLASIEELQNRLQELLILIKVDFSSNLNIVVTVTDADGD
ncbi:MAG: imelysin family protein [Lewinella sp.]